VSYASKQDIADEFKDIEFGPSTKVKPAQVVRFIQEADAFINSALRRRYQTPITGTASVKQLNTIEVTTVADSTLYTVTLNDLEANFTSGVGATALSIRDGLKAALVALKEAVDVADGDTNAKLTIKSQVAGVALSVSVTANLTNTETTANVAGDERLNILKNISINIVACRIAKILKLTVSNDDSIKQESTHCEAADESKKLLEQYANGTMVLEGATLISSGSGLADYNHANLVEPEFDKDLTQW
jgi:hypothetical protein